MRRPRGGISNSTPPSGSTWRRMASYTLGGRLALRLGRPVAWSWFDGAAVVDVVDETITMRFPTKFKATRVKNEYELALLACCSALVPSIKRVIFTTAARKAA